MEPDYEEEWMKKWVREEEYFHQGVLSDITLYVCYVPDYHEPAYITSKKNDAYKFLKFYEVFDGR